MRMFVRFNSVRQPLCLFTVGMLFLKVAVAASPQIKEGIDYTLITTPVLPTPEPKGKVSVKEFFSFTCVHCKLVDPFVEKTLQTNKKIDLNKIQVVWNGDITMQNFAKLNATLQILNMNNLYAPLFTAIAEEKNLSDSKILQTFLAQNGLSKDQVELFMSTYSSFAVAVKVGEYKKLTTSYNITGTPTFIVADKYIVKPAQPARLVEVTQLLANQVLTGNK